jgi:hypothetical protein
VQLGVDVRRDVHDLVGQRQDVTGGAEPGKRTDLRRRALVSCLSRTGSGLHSYVLAWDTDVCLSPRWNEQS